MQWKLLTQQQYLAARWSGGTTTQLAIEPEGAVYAEREFLWRLSSAGVEQDYSEFTPLPDYNRLLAPLQGQLELSIEGGRRQVLSPLELCSFDGGAVVESWGQCTDFNLMVRKGLCQGLAQALELAPGSGLVWTAPLPAPKEYPKVTLALYCVSGQLHLPHEKLTAQAGQLLLCRDGGHSHVAMETQAGAEVMAAVIRRK